MTQTNDYISQLRISAQQKNLPGVYLVASDEVCLF